MSDSSYESMMNGWMAKALERAEEIKRLHAEIERLKAGRFTEEEFQALCHNLTGADRERFEAGCRAYQDQLFGPRELTP